MSPDDALQKLLDGNKRFVSQNTQDRNFAEEIASTADGVDEASNRRVLYVVAATAPKSQGSFPNAKWKPLP